MTTYADATRCPDCAAPLPTSPERCPRCTLPLTGPTAVELFSALMAADRALIRLRVDRARSGDLAGVGAVAPQAPPAAGGLLDGAPAYPSARRTDAGAPARRPLSGASVPKILLSLGALCLLVAAVTFLAVAWSWLGVGGRTAVIALLTVVALGLSVLLPPRGLRMAGEALSVVGLGLLSLDAVGAQHAGWLGALDDGGLTLLTGALVSAAALGVLVIGRPRPLTAPAVIAAVATLVATFGATAVFDDSLVPMALSTGLLVAVAAVGRRVGLDVLTVSALAVAGLEWMVLVGVGIGRATSELTLAHLWGHLAIWPLVAGSALLAAVVPALRPGRSTSSLTYGAAALLGSVVVSFAVLDNGLTAAAGTLALLATAWTVVLVTAPARWSLCAAVPLVGTLSAPVGCALVLVASAVSAVAGTGLPFTRSFGVHVSDVPLAAAPWLLLPVAMLAVAAGCALAATWTPVRRDTRVVVLLLAVTFGAIGTLPLYDVPLAVVVGAVVAAGLCSIGAAGRWIGATTPPLAVGGLLLAVASVAALPSAAMTAVVLAVVVAVAAQHLRRTGVVGDVASAALPIALGGLDWAIGSWAGVPQVDRAAPLVLVVGALAIWRPRPTLEIPAAIVAAVAFFAAVAAADDPSVASAIHLTLIGALVTLTSLVNPARREVAWAGGLLLVAATWVRLWDVGVTVPEAYTLPTALVLVAVGAARLRREPDSGTLASLAPGLSLATVPSLLTTAVATGSLRALLLGVGCLVLVLAGTRLRWNAPLVIGAVVGALLVLLELAPYAALVPPWLLIGLSGTLLTIVGVTWESRMQDLRHAGRYVDGLR